MYDAVEAIVFAFVAAFVGALVNTWFVMLLLGVFASEMGNDAFALGFWQTFILTLIVGLMVAPAKADL